MGRIAPDAMYPAGTLSSRVISESVLLLGGPRALLLQLAHPKVAAGVADHSNFVADPFGRLVRTLEAMTTISFGSAAEAGAVLDHLARVHDHVTGTLPDGTPYHANDPALLHWVHATLVDTVLEVERRYLGVLSDRQRAQYYDESRVMARAFGIPDDIVPPDLPAFRAFMAHASQTLEVSETARRLSRAIITPRVPFVPGLLWEPIRMVTIDLLPRPLREAYGLNWDFRRKRLVRGGQIASRLVLPRVPRPLRNFPALGRHRLATAG